MNDVLKQQFITNLQTLVRFPSKLNERVGHYPYGVAIGEALEWFLALGKEYGFDVMNVDHQASYIEFGTGEEISILGHWSVVSVELLKALH